MDDKPIELATIVVKENENQNTEKMKEGHEIKLDEQIGEKKDTTASSSQVPKIKKIKKKEDKKGKKFLKKKELAGLAVRGEHLLRLVRTTKLNRQQVLNISKKFGEFSTTGHMTLDEFKKALEFEKEDKFAARLFTLFSPNKNTDGELSMDDFIMGVAKVAPEADINVKLDLFYELFDVDGNGTVVLSEFKEMTKYSMRHGRFGIDEDKLNSLINSVWKQLDGSVNVSGDNMVTRDEFKEVLLLQKTYVNSLTLQVPWLQAAFHSQGKAKEREYLDNEPLEELVFDVAQQFQAPQEQITKWIHTLKNNLYSDVKSLLEISSQDWTSMELPRRLYYAIKETIDPTHQTKEVEGRVKHSIAASGHRRIRNYIVTNKVLIMFTTLYMLGNAAMLAWTLVKYHKYLTPNVGQKYYDQAQLIGPSFVISRCGGALAKYNFAIILFPVCYRTMTWLRASTLEIVLPIDFAMKFHRRIGAFILFCGLMHMCAHCVNFLRLSKADVAGINNAFKWSLTAAPTQAFLHSTRTGVTGWIMVGCMLILVACALERVRRSNFRLFFSVHHLYLPIIVCLVIHDGLINPVEIVYWMIPPILLFLIERSITVWRGAPKYEALEGTRILKGDVLALQIKKPAWFKYSAGHYLWINCPSVSITEWHPFTLTSSPDEDFLMVDINCIGDWTKKLKEKFAIHLESPEKPSKDKEKGKSHSGEAGAEIEEVKSSENSLIKKDHHHKNAEVMVAMAGQYLPAFRIDGPYGTASSDVLLYTHAVLIGGGIGVTPFISILKSIRYAVLYTNGCPLHAVHFIWVTRNQENFQWFSMMLAELQRHEDLRGFLRVSIYLTGPRHPINDIRLLGVSLLMNKAKEKFNEDLVTGLEGQTHFGRPDFSKILLQLNHEWAGNDVGVFFCGPEPLAQAVSITCRAVNHANSVQKQSKKGTKAKGANFEFHQEHF